MAKVERYYCSCCQEQLAGRWRNIYYCECCFSTYQLVHYAEGWRLVGLSELAAEFLLRPA